MIPGITASALVASAPAVPTIYDYVSAAFNFDESAGTHVYDGSSDDGAGALNGSTPIVGGRNLTLSGGITWETSAPKLGQSCIVNPSSGSSGRALSNDGIFDFTSTDFYICDWICPTADAASSANWSMIYGRYAATNGKRQYALRLLPSYTLSLYMRDSSSSAGAIIEAVTPTNVLTNGVFSFVEVVFNWTDQTAEIWVNRVMKASVALTGVALQSGDSTVAFAMFNLSSSAASANSFVGKQDGMLIASGGLPTDAERDLLYNSGTGRSYRSLLSAIGKNGNYGEGGWTWFNDPRAMQIGGNPVVGSVTRDGSPSLSVLSDSTGAGTTLRLKPNYEADDHDNPGLLIRHSDSKVMAFYSAHNGTTRLRVSTAANDVSAFGSEVNLSSLIGDGDAHSYVNPVQLEGEASEPIYLFYNRGNPPNRPAAFTKSLDGGATWSASTLFVVNGTQRPYLKVVKNGSTRIDFFCTDGQPDEVSTNSVYHFYYSGGSYYKSDGTLIGHAPSFTPATDITRIFDGSTASGNSWVWDIQIDGGGSPVVVFARFPTTSDHRYMYAKLVSGSWVVSEICTAGGPLYAGQPHYSGGVSLDPDDVSKVYASIEVSGVHQVFLYTTSDGGSTWSGTQLTNDAYPSFRPYKVRGGTKVAYTFGLYTAYNNYDTKIRLIAP